VSVLLDVFSRYELHVESGRVAAKTVAAVIAVFDAITETGSRT
jgi:hypothetical protein